MDNRNKIINLIENVVLPYPKPAVYISGGIDSTILLHHLAQKTDETIYTFTWGYGQQNEFEQARKVADYYHTVHKEIVIDNFLVRFPEILKNYDRPLFFLQPYWGAEAAYKAGRECCYNANGLDEHFGGYWYKPHLNYVQSWADYYTYVFPSFENAHRAFGLKNVMPFGELDFKETLPYWDMNREKTLLRQAYKGILPSFVISRHKRTGALEWKLLWKRELSSHYPGLHPKNDEEIRKILNQFTSKVWLQTRLM